MVLFIWDQAENGEGKPSSGVDLAVGDRGDSKFLAGAQLWNNYARMMCWAMTTAGLLLLKKRETGTTTLLWLYPLG